MPHKVEGHAGGPDVDSLIPDIAKPQLWRAVEMCASLAEHGAGAWPGSDPLGAVKIRDLENPLTWIGVLLQKQVARLNVSVHDALQMQMVDAPEKVMKEWGRSRLREYMMGADKFIDAAAQTQLHADQDASSTLEKLVHFNNVGMS
jgi:hypothetical protein